MPINDEAQREAAVTDGEITLFLRNHVTTARIGVYPSERVRDQGVLDAFVDCDAVGCEIERSKRG